MKAIEFRSAIQIAHGQSAVFLGRRSLYERFVSDDIPSSTCALPTGLGKTSVIAIWLIALANHSGKVPRRLVYVVNRRTVVDQATDEARKYGVRLTGDLKQALSMLCSETKAGTIPLAISTLRGPVRRQPRVVGRSLTSGDHRRNSGHDWQPPVVQRLWHRVQVEATPRRVSWTRRVAGPRRSSSGTGVSKAD